MSETVWVDRRPFQTHGEAIGENGVVVFDPTCTPDKLLLPNDEQIPANLRGKRFVVEHVVRIDACPCGFKHGEHFSNHMAQYHLLRGCGNLSVVGCSHNNEWITVMLDEKRAECIRQISTLMGNNGQK